ncbi:hypothetical protein B484DRAFT_449896 [Ochromonadaceae sp. CCMP2298]|nr:hypothetical protein B484DRAFT_449896 [Ochromonadaceae sp. CCMP2298]
MASRAAAASHVEASLSSLSSDLLMRVANWLSVKELCTLDTAVSAKQLRAKFLSGLLSDTFLYRGADVEAKTSSEWQQTYAQWLDMRRVFVNSIILDDNTTATALALYDTMNRVNPGLESLTIDGDVTFPKDIAVRSAKTLHTLVLYNQGKSGIAQLRKLMGSVREWGSMGGSLQELWLEGCDFGNEAVDFGSCDALTKLNVYCCSSDLSTTPGGSLGCTRLMWGILHKCKNLKKFLCFTFSLYSVPLNARDLCLLARSCPHLTRLTLWSRRPETFNEAALVSVAMKCTKLQTLRLTVQSAFTDRTIEAIAANLVSLRELLIDNLELQNPESLRGLAVGCPQLQHLHIKKGNGHVTEAELLYLVEHAKNLQLLTIGKWEHLNFRESWGEIQPFAAEDLLQLGMEDPEALLSSQRDRLQVLRAATQQQPGGMDTLDKLRAASSNPRFKVTFPDW